MTTRLKDARGAPHPKPDLRPYLAHLEMLPFVEGAEVAKVDGRASTDAWRTAGLTLKTSRKVLRIDAVLVGSHLDYMRAEGLANFAKGRDRPIVFFVSYVAPPMAKFLAARGVNFVDLAGNCRVNLDDKLHAEIVGRRRNKVETAPGWRAAGYWTLFALLAEPELLRAPVRRLAEAAASGKTAAADALAKLRRDGAISTGDESAFLPGARARWAARWIAAYADGLRAAATIGRFRTPDVDPVALERRIGKTLAKWVYALGGAAGAYRLGTHYRSDQTVLHVRSFDEPLRRSLKALPAADGSLTVICVQAEPAYVGASPETAHPLLLYAEMAASVGPADDRLRQACAALRSEHLAWL